jgi:hypothetical protein
MAALIVLTQFEREHQKRWVVLASLTQRIVIKPSLRVAAYFRAKARHAAMLSTALQNGIAATSTMV